MMEANEAHVGENGNNNGEHNLDGDGGDNYNSDESESDVDSRGAEEHERDDEGSIDSLGIDVYEDEGDREAFELENGTLEQITAAKDLYRDTILPIKHNERNVDWLNIQGRQLDHLTYDGCERLGGFVARNTHLGGICLRLCHVTEAEEKVARFFKGPFHQFPPIETLEIIGHADRPLSGAGFDGLDRLDIIGNEDWPLLGPEVVQSLTPVLGMNLPLQYLKLEYVNLGLGGAAMELSSALKSCRCRLKHLCLEGTHLDDEASGELLWSLDSTRLEELCLKGNSIGRIGCKAFVPLLMRSDTLLRTLDLSDNLLDDECVRVLSESLENNSMLKTLTLDDNGAITDVGWKSVLKLVFDTTSLDSLYLSNHTLWNIGHVGDKQITDDIENALCFNRGFGRNSHSSKGCFKIAELLKSGGTFNKEPLQTFDLKLMPYVLAWIRRYCGRDMFHHVLRHWKIPVLYSFLSVERKKENNELQSENGGLQSGEDRLALENEGLREDNDRLAKRTKIG